MSPARKTVAAAPTSVPNLLLVYAKAVVALLVSAVASLTTWSAAIGPGHIDRTGWIALGGAIVTPLATALGVAIVTNARASSTDEEAA